MIDKFIEWLLAAFILTLAFLWYAALVIVPIWLLFHFVL